MLGAGLRREFPGAFEWAGRMRRRLLRPRVARTGMWWAVLAGLGASVLVTGLAGALVSLALSLIDPRTWPFPPWYGAVRFLGVGAGGALAARIGRWRGLLVYAGAIAALDLAAYAAGAPGRALFCERAGDPCPLPGGVDRLLAYWPLLAGLLIVPAFSRALSIGPGRSNPSLEAAGVFVVASTLGQLALVPFTGPADAAGSFVGWTGLSLTAAILSGRLLVRRGAAPWPAGVLLAVLLFVVPWLPSLLRYSEFRRSQASAEVEWLMLSPIAYALAFLVGAIVTAALARSPRPDADAARRARR